MERIVLAEEHDLPGMHDHVEAVASVLVVLVLVVSSDFIDLYVYGSTSLL